MASNRENVIRFEADLDKFAKQVDIELGVLVRRIAIQVFTGVIQKTPVDTGRARSAWTMDVGRKPRMVAAVSVSRNTSFGLAMGRTRVLDKLKRDPYQNVWIVNHVPYAVALEYGHSKQAPRGMVRITLSEVNAQLSRISA